ncbi:MAG TPA: hypothetical protein VLB50_03285 [Ignavibacteriaceae bacterium]|nr:hypothetical protein [Ignavibacteriaceae bacterium]
MTRNNLPNSNEINAETMLALAHGVHGIFYEDYYSHLFNDKQDTVRALVAVPEHDYLPYPEWYQVQRIANRMKGYFGQAYWTL